MRLDHLFFNPLFCQERSIDKRTKLKFRSFLYVFNNTQKVFCSLSFLSLFLFFSGVYGGFETHVPIPNTIVKRARDDGTALRVWESSSTPDFFLPVSTPLYKNGKYDGLFFLYGMKKEVSSTGLLQNICIPSTTEIN